LYNKSIKDILMRNVRMVFSSLKNKMDSDNSGIQN
jgi:hypothetical protein